MFTVPFPSCILEMKNLSFLLSETCSTAFVVCYCDVCMCVCVRGWLGAVLRLCHVPSCLLTYPIHNSAITSSSEASLSSVGNVNARGYENSKATIARARQVSHPRTPVSFIRKSNACGV